MFIREILFDFKNIQNKKYLKRLPYYNLKQLNFSRNIIFITGTNGIGKTKLLEVLAYSFNINKYGGSNNFILDETNKPDLFDYCRIIKNPIRPKDAFFFRSDSFFNLEKDLVRYNCPISDYSGERTFKQQSHGEGTIEFFKNRIRSNGIYFFDEPETALSFNNQLLFLFLLREFEKKESQIFIITHSPVLLAYPNSEIINLESNSVSKISYEDTEQFNSMRDFLNNYKLYQKEIFKDN